MSTLMIRIHTAKYTHVCSRHTWHPPSPASPGTYLISMPGRNSIMSPGRRPARPCGGTIPSIQARLNRYCAASAKHSTMARWLPDWLRSAQRMPCLSKTFSDWKRMQAPVGQSTERKDEEKREERATPKANAGQRTTTQQITMYYRATKQPIDATHQGIKQDHASPFRSPPQRSARPSTATQRMSANACQCAPAGCQTPPRARHAS